MGMRGYFRRKGGNCPLLMPAHYDRKYMYTVHVNVKKTIKKKHCYNLVWKVGVLTSFRGSFVFIKRKLILFPIPYSGPKNVIFDECTIESSPEKVWCGLLWCSLLFKYWENEHIRRQKLGLTLIIELGLKPLVIWGLYQNTSGTYGFLLCEMCGI